MAGAAPQARSFRFMITSEKCPPNIFLLVQYYVQKRGRFHQGISLNTACSNGGDLSSQQEPHEFSVETYCDPWNCETKKNAYDFFCFALISQYLRSTYSCRPLMLYFKECERWSDTTLRLRIWVKWKFLSIPQIFTLILATSYESSERKIVQG